MHVKSMATPELNNDPCYETPMCVPYCLPWTTILTSNASLYLPWNTISTYNASIFTPWNAISANHASLYVPRNIISTSQHTTPTCNTMEHQLSRTHYNKSQLAARNVASNMPLNTLLTTHHTRLPVEQRLLGADEMEPKVLTEIRRLVTESEVAHSAAHGNTGGITFSSGSSAQGGGTTPRLLQRPSTWRPAG